MYHLFFKLVLRHVDPERAHAMAKRSLRVLRASSLGRALLRRLVGPIDPCLQVRVMGLTFSSPLGVAAGVDKDADWFEDLMALGFGFVEIGTVTALPQEGNSPPRVQRLLRDRAILNRMGFPNRGAESAAGRLASRPPGSVVGVNVGKSRAAPVTAAGEDYRSSVRHMAAVSDYLVLNVSSPNTPGLRELQDVDRLRQLVADVREELAARGTTVPLLVKVDPDLDEQRLRAIAEAALALRLDGIVAVNTTVDRRTLTVPAAASLEDGGISGPPLRSTAIEVLRSIRSIVGEELVLISVGGVQDAEDVWERIRAGATLVQVYTALVYEGPAWPKRVNRMLAAKVREAGLSSIQDLVGDEERSTGGETRLNEGLEVSSAKRLGDSQ